MQENELFKAIFFLNQDVRMNGRNMNNIKNREKPIEIRII